MSEVVALRGASRTAPRISDAEYARVEVLAEAFRLNRFMPTPPPENIFVGDGDFRAIGAEFLGHLVRLGGLKPRDRVLDIGCGIGRIALPLTQYLDPEIGSYEGFDPVAGGIDWCVQAITSVYPRFRFHHLDLSHPLYNPGGQLDGAGVRLPDADETIDFALMVSVATHLTPDEIRAYASEIARVLAPGGRLFLTAFIVDRSAQDGKGRDPRLSFQRAGNGPSWHVDPDAPLGAVGFDDGFLETTLAAAGLIPISTNLGHWRGREGAHYQDIIIATKPGRTA